MPFSACASKKDPRSLVRRGYRQRNSRAQTRLVNVSAHDARRFALLTSLTRREGSDSFFACFR